MSGHIIQKESLCEFFLPGTRTYGSGSGIVWGLEVAIKTIIGHSNLNTLFPAYRGNVGFRGLFFIVFHWK
jgi:hypothetical protein